MEEVPPPPRDPYQIGIPVMKHNNKNEPPVKMSVLDITELLKDILPRRDLQYNLTNYKNSFYGSDLVSELAQKFHLTRSKALLFATKLQKEYSIFHHVTNDHIIQDTPHLYFRLQCDHTPNILNSYRIWTERVDRNPMGLLKRLKSQLNMILHDYTDNDG